MDKNIEKEFKILVSKEQFEILKEDYEPLNFEKQVNVYYDSKDFIIKNKKGAMRIRTKNGKHIFTLKMHSPEGLREYECEVDKNDVSSLQKEEIVSLLNEYKLHADFSSIATLTTYRAVYESEFAELCFDISYYNNTMDYEIEYEFKKEHDGITIFNSFLSKANLTYTKNCKSKIKRALGM